MGDLRQGFAAAGANSGGDSGAGATADADASIGAHATSNSGACPSAASGATGAADAGACIGRRRLRRGHFAYATGPVASFGAAQLQTRGEKLNSDFQALPNK